MGVFVLRIFKASPHAVRLPGLPRQVIILALTILITSLVFIVPYLLAEWVNRTMRETISQAAVLSKLTDMNEVVGRRAPTESQAMRMAGFEVVMAGEVKRVWLVERPSEMSGARTSTELDLTGDNLFDGLATMGLVLLAEPQTQFAIVDRTLPNAENIRVIASFRVWQEFIGDLIFRVFMTAISVGIVFTFIFRIIFRRLMLQSLDDLFLQLYGSAAMGVSNSDDAGSLLASLNAFQDRMREHIDEQARLAALGAGASFLAHDIRNLLASLQLNAEQLMELPGEKEQRIGKRLASAIEQSLSLVEWAALYTSGKRDNLDVQRQKLRPIIDEALNFVRLHDPRRRVQLVNECPGNVDVVAERTLMFRILYNLALNGVQAMKGQKTMQQIRVHASSNKEACIIRVSDSGPGLPGQTRGTALMPHIGGARGPDSTGLGLKIVTDLVSWHGGRVDILHSDDYGTQFQITLPHHTPGAPRDETVGSAAEVTEGESESESKSEAAPQQDKPQQDKPTVLDPSKAPR